MASPVGSVTGSFQNGVSRFSRLFSAQVNAGNVRLLRGEWNRAFIEELRQFPTGKHDDQVDAVADAFSELCQESVTVVRNYFTGKPNRRRTEF